jgi:hypothetical protein
VRDIRASAVLGVFVASERRSRAAARVTLRPQHVSAAASLVALKRANAKNVP